MATNQSLCAICDLRHLTTSSTHWCPECEEALCINCKEHHSLSRSSRTHQVIPISAYNNLPSFIANIDLFCSYHNEKYTQYCVKHECPICYKCIKEHGSCEGVTVLEDLTLDVKTSEVFRDMEQGLTDIMGNISRIREDRESYVKIIRDKKELIISDVTRLKQNINSHLDKMQEDFMKELNKVEAECCETIQSIVSSLNDQETELIQYNAEIENMRKHASDIQAFLGMRVIQKEITKNEDCIRSIIQDKNVEKIALSYSIDPYIQDFLTNVQKLGSTIVVSNPAKGTELVRIKDRQAQILVAKEEQVVNTVNNIKFNLKQDLNTTCVKTRGCCVTAQTEYFFTDYNNNQEKLVALNSFGKTDFTLTMSAEYYSFYDLVCIDAKTVAISTGYSHDKTGVMIMDFVTKVVKRFIELPGTPFGVTFDGDSLYCCCCEHIYRISCTDFSYTKIQNTSLSPNSYIAKHCDRIFYTAPDEDKVVCVCSGTQVWEFKNKSVLRNPGGISVDDKGNVFVAGVNSKNIIVISPNGKHYTQIQTNKYGLTNPRTIFFDSIRKQMLVSNDDRFAHLYDISYS